MKRLVVLLCGPPGAGKTTEARRSGLAVYDRDDPQWISEQHFTSELAKVAADPKAQAVVIRTGASSAARAKAAAMIAATHVFVLTADPDELANRIRQRGRADKVKTLAGVRSWFDRYDQDDRVQPFPGWAEVREPGLGVMSEDW